MYDYFRLHTFGFWSCCWHRRRRHVSDGCLQAQLGVVFRVSLRADSLLAFLFPEHEGDHQAISSASAGLAFGWSGMLHGRSYLA